MLYNKNMTKREIASIVKTISSVLGIETPQIKYSETQEGVFLEAGLFQGCNLVVFNPEFIKYANDLHICITVAHEVRHIYQMCEVKNMIEGLPHVAEAELWLEDMRNGKSDTPEDSKEVDATIFAHVFVAGVLGVGFDIVKMNNTTIMKKVFESLKGESWYDSKFDNIVFHEKEKCVFIGQKNLLEEALTKETYLKS